MKNDALKIIDSALKSASPYKTTFEAVCNENYNSELTVISVGKAACSMAKAAHDALGSKITRGYVLTKYGYATDLPEVFNVREAGHPIPDENSVKYTREITDMAYSLKKEDKLLFLLSGGGSALFEDPVIPLQELSKMTDFMLRSGADIYEINAVRKLFSSVKGGKFSASCECEIDCFILSDVIGDDPRVIASAPCYSHQYDLSDGLDVYFKYFEMNCTERRYSRQAVASFDTPKNAKIKIVGNVHSLCSGAANAAEKLGYDAVIVTQTLTGEAREQTEKIIKDALSFAKTPHKPTVFIYGGETTVTVKGNGKGGRNQEAALTAAILLKGSENILFFALGSDGTDGPTDAAGGFADGSTFEKIKMHNIDPTEYLDNNDSYNALKASDDLIVTGATGTNVNDIFAVIIK